MSTNTPSIKGDLVMTEHGLANKIKLSILKYLANKSRIIACVNACEGIQDPVAEIAQLKAKITQLEQEKQSVMDYIEEETIYCNGRPDDPHLPINLWMNYQGKLTVLEKVTELLNNSKQDL